jgi:NAD(P)-dependent dehydrogenase (short-subunit alcohol dehydrogenase family)
MDESHMKKNTILVTGGTSGIGKAAALEMARLGARVVITARDEEKGKRTLQEIRDETGNPDIHLLFLDLASLDSVRQSAKDFLERFDRLDVLVNNAGGYYGLRKTTAEGYEYTFGVNHLGHFLFTILLKETLIASKARIINVSSEAQKMGKMRFEDLMQDQRRSYSGIRAYAQAKLANIIFTYELERRWGNSGITANAMHPGAVATNFGSESRFVFRNLMKVGKPFLKSPAKGADTIIYLATSPDVQGISGRYFVRRREIRSNGQSHDPHIAKRLWEVSESLTGLN